MKLLVILNQLNKKELESIDRYQTCEAEILNLSDDDFLSDLQFIDRSKQLSQHQPKVVEAIKDMIGKMGTKAIYHGKNIKQLLAVPVGVSMWWFNDLQYKFYQEYLLCNWLVYCETIKDLIDSSKYDQVIIYGKNSPLINVIRQLIPDSRVSFHRQYGYSPNSEYIMFLKGLLQTIFYALFSLWQTFSIRLFYRSSKALNQRPDVTFFSIYPGSLVESNDKLKDRYYGRLPEELQSGGLAVNYLSTLDRKKDIKTLFNLKYLKQAVRADYKIVFLESYSTLFDMVSQLINYLKLSLKILMLPADAKTSFCTIDGKDYSPIFLEPFLKSVYGYQNYRSLLLIKAAEKYADKYKPKMLFSCYVINHVGRAINCGFRISAKKIPIVGLQHASYPSTKLETRYHSSELDPKSGGKDLIKYAPFADYELFQGKATRDLFVKAGLSEERALLLGSPRFDSLYDAINQKQNAVNSKQYRLLVAVGLFEHDIRQLLNVIFEAVDDRFLLIFKPHPNKPIDAMLRIYKTKYPNVNYEIVSENIYELLNGSDLLITTHSTVAEEAIVLGKPAISVHAGTHLNIGALASLGLDVCAHDAIELREKIDKYLFLDREGFAEMRSYVVEQCFGILDGKATERIASFIGGLL
ncbi:MAG: hypothetical protein ABIH50_00425 [bacterium]